MKLSLVNAMTAAMIEANQLRASRGYSFRPIYRYSMGKDWLKPVRNSKYTPHQGERECLRRREVENRK